MTSQLQQIWTRYNELLSEGKDDEARTFIMEEFPKLPQDLREQLLGEMLTIAMEDEVEGQAARTELQEEGIDSFKALNETGKQAPPA